MSSAQSGGGRGRSRLDAIFDRLEAVAAHRRELWLKLLVVGLLALAALRLGVGYQRLVWFPPAKRSAGYYIAEGEGAVDLMARRFEATDYFVRRETPSTRVYPPATYAILWPFTGRGSVSAARWTWAALSTAALAWLCRTSARACGFRQPLARFAFGLLPLTFLSTSAALSVGQLSPVVMALVVAAALRLSSAPRTLRDDLVGAVAFALSAVKPTLAIPFGWLLLFLPGSLRPAGISAAVYGGLTAAAILVRNFARGAVTTATAVVRPDGAALGTPVPVATAWASGQLSAVPVATPDAATRSFLSTQRMFHGGYANFLNLLVDLGIDRPWVLLPALIATAALGPWAWRHRRDDPWILLGVAGLVARLGFYHRVYDDLLVLPALVALARLASGVVAPSDGTRVDVATGVSRSAMATLLLVACPMMAPRDFPPVEWRVAASWFGWLTAFGLLVLVVGPGATRRGWILARAESLDTPMDG